MLSPIIDEFGPPDIEIDPSPKFGQPDETENEINRAIFGEKVFDLQDMRESFEDQE